MAQIHVRNPHPRLVNVAQPNGRFVRIVPNGSAEVDDKSVERLVKSGELEVVKGEAALDDSTENKTASKTGVKPVAKKD